MDWTRTDTAMAEIQTLREEVEAYEYLLTHITDELEREQLAADLQHVKHFLTLLLLLEKD